MSDTSFNRPRSFVLFLKVLVISGPIFAICVGLATYVLWKENTRREQELFAASIGNAAARVSVTLANKYEVLNDNGMLDDFVSTLAANPSIRCAELVFSDHTRAIHPRVVGCKVKTAELFHQFPVLPDQGISLNIGVSEAYLRAKIDAFAKLALIGYLVSFLISVLSSWVAFKYVVGRPLDDLVANLMEALEASSAANQTKMRFLANISHEIRTPMNGILGAAAILKKTRLDAKQFQLLDAMQTSSNNMLGMIEDILDFSKLGEESFKLDLAQFDLHEFITDCTDLPAINARQKGLEFCVNFDNDLGPEFFGDKKRLGQVLTNLVCNALKFTEKGSIQVRASRGLGPSPHVVIEVIDTGIGIASENVEKIFDAFSQEDESTTRRFGGTGLGLAICRDLVRKMDGTLTVESQKSKGSTFRIELPGLLSDLDQPARA